MFRKVDDFIEQWASETDATLKIFNALTDASLAQKVTEDGRSIGRLAWHIVTTVGEMAGRTGLKIEAPAENSEIPKTAAAIVTAYKNAADSLGLQVKQHWTDEALTETVDMYGETWRKGVVLSVLILHQVHHRAQITILMRQAGLKVPGVYGPSREEWKRYGMPAME
jgi:uncharacterized damage-inducible protein DinB